MSTNNILLHMVRNEVLLLCFQLHAQYLLTQTFSLSAVMVSQQTGVEKRDHPHVEELIGVDL